MRQSKLSGKQTVYAIHQINADTSVGDRFRHLSVNDATFRG